MSIAPQRSRAFRTAFRRPSTSGASVLACLLAVVVIVLVLHPMVTTSSAFSADWPVHLWLLRHQGDSVLAHLHPSYFVHSEDGVFYPHFAFYGGTLYALGGPLVTLLGDNGRNGYVLEWGLLLAMGYGGWVWLGRLAGLGRWSAQAPAIVFATAPHYVSLVYSRGDWPELAAVSAIPLLGAATFAVLQTGRMTFWRGGALALATILLTGSHGQTLLWAATLAAVVISVVLVVDRSARRRVRSRAGLEVLGVVLPAALVNAWFLLPDLAYQAQAFITSPSAYATWRHTLLHTHEILPAPLFTLRPTGSGDLGVALPILAMGWAVTVAAMRPWKRDDWRRGRHRLFLLLVVLTVALVGLVIDGALLVHLPKPYLLIQYTFRLENYILITVAGGVLVALLFVRERGQRVRRISWTVLALILALSVTEAAHQAGPRPDGGHLNDYWSPGPQGLGNYASARGTEFGAPQRKTITFPPREIHGDRVTIVARAAPGQLVDTNLVTMPPLLQVHGASVAGFRVVGEGEARRLRTVLRISPDAQPGAARVTVQSGSPLPVLAGRVLSLLGLVGLLANVAVRWRRPSARS